MSGKSESGWGRLFLDPAKQHDDLRLWRRAIRQRWDIDEDFKKVAITRLKRIIEDGEDDEIALKAIAETRHLMAQNQADEHKVVDVHISASHDRLPEIAADLGIEICHLEDAEREAGGGGSGSRSDDTSQASQ